MAFSSWQGTSFWCGWGPAGLAFFFALLLRVEPHLAHCYSACLRLRCSFLLSAFALLLCLIVGCSCKTGLKGHQPIVW